MYQEFFKILFGEMGKRRKAQNVFAETRGGSTALSCKTGQSLMKQKTGGELFLLRRLDPFFRSVQFNNCDSL